TGGERPPERAAGLLRDGREAVPAARRGHARGPPVVLAPPARALGWAEGDVALPRWAPALRQFRLVAERLGAGHRRDGDRGGAAGRPGGPPRAGGEHRPPATGHAVPGAD